VRAAIGGVLNREQDIEVVGEADSLSQALELLEARAPDVMLLDLGLRDGFSLPAIPELLQRRADLRIVVLTMYDEPGFRRRALAAGAVAFLLKDGPPATLVETVRASG
jgi:DNA-binding NarL/FixJ family response regulator